MARVVREKKIKLFLVLCPLSGSLSWTERKETKGRQQQCKGEIEVNIENNVLLFIIPHLPSSILLKHSKLIKIPKTLDYLFTGMRNRNRKTFVVLSAVIPHDVSNYPRCIIRCGHAV